MSAVIPRNSDDITARLQDWSNGSSDALGELMPMVFDDLRRCAHFYFQREDADHTLQPTQLIGMVWERLTGWKKVQWDSRRQFFAFAGQLMRRMLVDYANARDTAKRGGHVEMCSLTGGVDREAEAPIDPETLIALHEALKTLATIDPQAAQIVELRFFAGLTIAETAMALEISKATIKRDWNLAKEFLARELGGAHERAPAPFPFA